MSDWFHNYVELKGDPARPAALEAHFKREGGDQYLDFESIIPQPVALDGFALMEWR